MAARKRRKLRGKPRVAIWLLLPPLILATWWAATSDDPVADHIRRVVNPSHVETVAPATVAVKAKSFSYFRFTVPRAATNVEVVGEFTASGGDKNVETYVLPEAAFVSWQYGYAPDTFYSSGRVSHGSIAADLPSGTGAYYIVFNNKFSTRDAKTVEVSATLQYRHWWPSGMFGF